MEICVLSFTKRNDRKKRSRAKFSSNRANEKTIAFCSLAFSRAKHTWFFLIRLFHCPRLLSLAENNRFGSVFGHSNENCCIACKSKYTMLTENVMVLLGRCNKVVLFSVTQMRQNFNNCDEICQEFFVK